MSCALFISWISLAIMLSTVVPATGKQSANPALLPPVTVASIISIQDSCASTFGGWKTKRTIETSTTLPESTTVTIPPTTPNITIMTEPTASGSASLDKTLKQDAYEHVERCEGQYDELYCIHGTCYVHKYQNKPVYVCECSEGYHGDRCDFKSLEGSYGGGMKLRIRRTISRPARRRSKTPRMFDFMCFVTCAMLVVSKISLPFL